jgi:hypothetical protein
LRECETQVLVVEAFRDCSLRGAFFAGVVDDTFELISADAGFAAGFDLPSSFFEASFFGFFLSPVAV